MYNGPLGKARNKCEDNITINLKEIDNNTKNWVDSTQDRDYWKAPGSINHGVKTTAGKRLIGRCNRNWKEDIRMYLKEIVINTRNLDDSPQDRDCWRVPLNAALNPMELVISLGLLSM